MTRNSSQGSNIHPIRDDDRRFVEGEVGFVELRVVPSRRIADHTPPFGERLVCFFRRRQFQIALICYAIAVTAACLFAFQMGRGL